MQSYPGEISRRPNEQSQHETDPNKIPLEILATIDTLVGQVKESVIKDSLARTIMREFGWLNAILEDNPGYAETERTRMSCTDSLARPSVDPSVRVGKIREFIAQVRDILN